jgi:hypothetical protein
MKYTSAKGILTAGVLASYLALSPTTSYAQVKQQPTIENLAENKTHGLVVSSNKDLVLAQLAIESLKEAGMKDAFLYKININNQVHYRSVVPYGKEGMAEIKKKVSELEQFDAAGAFAIPLIIQDSKGKKTTLEGKISDYNASAAEKSLTRNAYVSRVAPYVKKVHDSYYRKQNKVISPNQANAVMGYIYDASKEFKAPLLRITSHYLHESKGDPFAQGDLDKAPNIAVGPFQTRLYTIDYSLKKMRAEGVKGLPESVEEAEKDLRTLVRVGVWYYMHNLNQKGSNMELATKKFNAGHNSRNPKNNKYLRSVLGEESKLTKALKPKADN